MRLIINLNKNIFKNEEFMEILGKLTGPDMLHEPAAKYYTLEIREKDLEEIPDLLRDRVNIIKI